MNAGRWLLVLGSNSDMAIATARHYAKFGWSVYLASRDAESAQKEADHLAVRYGVKAKVLKFDATDFASHAPFYAALEPKPEGVVLAFGTMAGDAPQIIGVNLTGAANVLETIAADFEARKSGFIVGISSVAGDRGRASNYLYGCAKAGLSAYLSGLRHRLFKSGVVVLTVKPGFTATKMTAGMDLPAKLTASPDEVAEAIYRGVLHRKNVIYVKPVWRLIMLIIIHLPEFIFKKTKL